MLGSLLRIFYADTIGPKVVTVLKMSSIREGFMDLIETTSQLLNQRGHGRVRFAIRSLKYRKFTKVY